MKTRASVLAVTGFCALALPASAQIITTSIPRADSGAGASGGEKRWAVHFMATPLANWQIKDYLIVPASLFTGDPGGDNIAVPVTGEAKGRSKFLVAGEASFLVGDNGAVGVGGWYNNVGELDRVANAVLSREAADYFGLPTGEQEIERVPQDMGSFTEVHANAFWKDFGIQGGLVFLSNELLFEESRTDWDAYAIYRRSFGKAGVVSVGAGVYTSGSVEFEGIVIDKYTRFSGFVTASVPVYKGLTVDGSFWYIGNSSDANEADLPDNMSRYMVGVGYTF